MAPDKAKLSAPQLAKLASILPLLASDKAGEVVAAAAAAQRLLSAHALTFRDLVERPPAAVEQTQPTGSFDIFLDWPTRWRSAVYQCQSAPGTWLTPFERQFVANLSKYKHKPSEAQLDILATIASNVLARRGGAQ